MIPEMTIIKSFFIGILLFVALPSHSQEVCSETLTLAGDRLDKGKFYEIPDLLEDCLNNGGFTKDEEIRAYHLLTLSQLYLEYREKAGEYYLKLLKLSPEYQPNPDADPKELVNFSRLYTTKPLIHLIAHAGATLTWPHILVANSMTNAGKGKKKYTSKIGIEFATGAEFLISGNWYLVTELEVVSRSLKVSESHFENSFYQSTVDIVQWEFVLPIMLRYTFWSGKINPFANVGISPRFVINASAKNQHGNFVDFNGELQPIKASPTINLSSVRTTLNYSIVGGIGINYKLGISYLTMEMRYTMDMFNTVDVLESSRLDLEGSRNVKFYSPVYAEDDYRLTNLSVMVGYNFPLYKPRKINK